MCFEFVAVLLAFDAAVSFRLASEFSCAVAPYQRRRRGTS